MEVTTGIVSIVIVLTIQMIKEYYKPNKKLIPVLAISFAILANFLWGSYIGINEWPIKLLSGILMGYTAMGMYSGTKTMIEEEAK